MINIGITKKFGTIVQRLRKKLKLSQEDLADASGLHINTIHLLEKGLNEPKISTFLFLAKGLEIAPVELMTILMEEYYKASS